MQKQLLYTRALFKYSVHVMLLFRIFWTNLRDFCRTPEKMNKLVELTLKNAETASTIHENVKFMNLCILFHSDWTCTWILNRHINLCCIFVRNWVFHFKLPSKIFIIKSFWLSPVIFIRRKELCIQL